MVRLLGSAPAAPVPIVIDCANGVGGAKAKVLAERLGNLVSFRSAHVPCIRATCHICAGTGLASATSAPGLANLASGPTWCTTSSSHAPIAPGLRDAHVGVSVACKSACKSACKVPVKCL